MFSFQSVAVMMLFWMIVSTVTFISNLDDSASDDFVNTGNSVFTTESVVIDPPEGRSGLFEFPSLASGWVGNIVKAATLQSPLWEGGWTEPVRIVLLTIMGAFVLVMVLKGAEIAVNALPG